MTALSKNSPNLKKRPIGTGQVKNSKIHNRRIKESIAQRESLGVTFAEIDARVQLAGLLDHRYRKIKTEDGRAPSGCRGSDVAGTGGNIKKLRAARYSNRI